MNPDRQIFLSAVSREFRRCREMLRSELMGPDMPYRVAEQSDFAVGGGTLLEKLDRYVSQSAAVIHLIGKSAGVTSKPKEVESFLHSRPDFLARNPGIRSALGDCSQLSYTQWEAYMALHYGVPLFVFLPAEGFDEFPPGFTTDAASELRQQEHLALLVRHGIDRGKFLNSDRLCNQVLRSLSGLLYRTGNKVDQDQARDLEAFAQSREKEEAESEGDERATLTPLHLDLLLPPHLLVGQSTAVQFCLREPGRTSLENIVVDLTIGNARTTVSRDLLAKNQTLHLSPDAGLLLEQKGTLPMHLTVTCERSSLREKFAWKDVANVITPEALLSRTGSFSLKASQTRRIRLELVEEDLRPRRGVVALDLQPVPAAGKRFEMGSPTTERGHQPDEELHPVRFAHSWWMSRHPISQGQFLAVMGRNPAKFHDQSDRFPIENITWFEAVEFCERLTQLELTEEKLPLGFHYRLPTEAEWEYSCRAGEEAIPQTSSSRTASEVSAIAHAISTYPLDGNRGANRYGLCDLTGNVFHWCLDDYGPYTSHLEVDPCPRRNDSLRVIRGGSWHDPATLRRPAARMKCAPTTTSSRIGFRVVLARV